MEISKRQVVRILTSRLEDFVAEDRAVLRTGLATAPFISVDDTGARHARRDGITTQIGGARFTVFRTGRSKSQLNFLCLLQAAGEDCVRAGVDLRGRIRRRGADAFLYHPAPVRVRV